MPGVAVLAVVVLGVVALAGPGCAESSSGAAEPERLALRACEALARSERLVVLCPGWLPSRRGQMERYEGYSLSRRDFESGRCHYLTQLGYRGPGAGEAVPFHVLFGGRCRPIALAGGVGSTLRTRALRLVPSRIEAKLEVDGARALVLRVPPYPGGGIHGGHYAIVWNRGGHGYVLSLHLYRGDSAYDGYPRPLPPRGSDIRALRRAAERMVEVGAPAG